MKQNGPFRLTALFNVLGIGAVGALALALIVLFVLNLFI